MMKISRTSADRHNISVTIKKAEEVPSRTGRDVSFSVSGYQYQIPNGITNHMQTSNCAIRHYISVTDDKGTSNCADRHDMSVTQNGCMM